MADKVKCWRCGVEQDPDHPICVHMLGKLGGAAVKAKHGEDFFRRIGSKGGARTMERRGPEFYERIGKLGGEKVKAERGHDYYQRIGKKGGETVKSLIERGKRHSDD